MTQKEIFKYWMESSDDDFRTMEHLLESGDYSWALFLGHKRAYPQITIWA